MIMFIDLLAVRSAATASFTYKKMPSPPSEGGGDGWTRRYTRTTILNSEKSLQRGLQLSVSTSEDPALELPRQETKKTTPLGLQRHSSEWLIRRSPLSLAAHRSRYRQSSLKRMADVPNAAEQLFNDLRSAASNESAEADVVRSAAEVVEAALRVLMAECDDAHVALLSRRRRVEEEHAPRLYELPPMIPLRLRLDPRVIYGSASGGLERGALVEYIIVAWNLRVDRRLTPDHIRLDFLTAHVKFELLPPREN